MKMKLHKSIVVLVLVLGLLFPAITKAQTVSYVAHYTEKDQIKRDTLVDKQDGTKFIIDRKRIFITAIDKNGKQLWKTDPATDNKLEEYRTKRPTIVYFEFSNELKKQVILISYNNSQAGYIDKQTGKFYFQGQD